MLMERAHRRVAARKEREMAPVLSPVLRLVLSLVLSLVAEMESAMPRWRERILLR